MIRPSSLSIARFCQLSPVLSEQFPSRSEATDRGNEVDGQVTAEIRDGVVATDGDARACIDWLSANLDAGGLVVQVPVRLSDPDTGGLLTAGTPDVVHLNGDHSVVTVVDLKKREQMLAGRLAAPDDNLQLHAYALAEASRVGAQAYRLCLLLFGDGEVEEQWSRVYTVETWAPALEEIRAIQDQQSASPVATSGPHCLACYPRVHCPSWTLPALQGPSEMEPFTRPGGLTVENFPRALAAKKALEDVAKLADAQLKAFADANGGSVPMGGGKVYRPVWSKGKAYIDTDAMAAELAKLTDKDVAGVLTAHTKKGAPFPTYRLTNEKGAR